MFLCSFSYGSHLVTMKIHLCHFIHEENKLSETQCHLLLLPYKAKAMAKVPLSLT